MSLTTAELEDRLDELLDPVLSSRRTAAAPAATLGGLPRAAQDTVLHWVAVIAKTNAELAYQFADRAAQVIDQAGSDALEEWVVRGLDVYDREGLYPGCAVFQDVAGFTADLDARASGLELEEVSGVLERFVRGLSGRPLRIAADEYAYTDTETLYLPARLAVFEDKESNFSLYKAMVGHLWAQTWFGTFRLDPAALCAGFPDPERAARLFHTLETVRLDARLRVELAGLARDMQALQRRCGEPDYPQAWALRLRRLNRPEATVRDTIDVMRTVYKESLPPPRCYQGAFYPERAMEVIRARQERERAEFQRLLARLRSEFEGEPGESEQAQGARRFGARRREDGDAQSGDASMELTLDGRPLAPPDEAQALMKSIIQDFGEIPEEYLVAAGDGDYDADAAPEKRSEDVWKGTYHEEGAFLYNEWDFRRKHYRKNWCVLREIDVHPHDESFVNATLAKYAGLVVTLRKTFEALRGEDRLLKKQKNGDNVDLDALVEALADARAGRELTDRLFTRPQRVERSIAVMFMVDMSGSTKGWINDAERESLVLMCEALEVLGDSYAIYGFSGMTRKRCELYRIKRFDEPYSPLVRSRITGIRPQDYTRMGVVIRHLCGLLAAADARTKLLITLSDGKPDDYDGYRGEYGIEDTRQALIEAKRDGIHAFCITIDKEARDYLPHMYGPVNYTLVDDVHKLPVKVSDIYRRLTT